MDKRVCYYIKIHTAQQFHVNQLTIIKRSKFQREIFDARM